MQGETFEILAFHFFIRSLLIELLVCFYLLQETLIVVEEQMVMASSNTTLLAATENITSKPLSIGISGKAIMAFSKRPNAKWIKPPRPIRNHNDDLDK